MTESSDAPITPELRAWVGKATPLKPLELVTASTVRRYVDATGDSNPLWLDDAFARSEGYQACILPPLLVGWLPFSIKRRDPDMGFDAADLRHHLPLPKAYTNVRNARNVSVEFEWLRRVTLGEQLFTESSITDIAAREGKRGWGIYVTQENRILDRSREVVLRRRQTIVLLPEAKFRDTSGRDN
jgi:acyl dehydratase